jgi:hypothetical protein
LTTIVRGAPDGTEFWTVEMVVPSGGSDPDPDAPASALRDEASAKKLAADLVGQGFPARAEEVRTPRMADYAGGVLGWRVRVGRFGTQADADVDKGGLAAAGHAGSSVYTGWDGENPDDSGPWVVQTLTIDPEEFRGTLAASFGPDVEQRETTTALADAADATAGVNAGYFVLDPKSGAPGDPAGVGVYQGRLLSETVGSRPALLLRDDARDTSVERLSWSGSLSRGRSALPLDGINRQPGLIRNCGGLGDQPSDRPQHDFTCTDDGELILVTPEYAGATPSGPGAEVVLDGRDRVTAVRTRRGTTLPSGGRSVQATGDRVGELVALARVGRKLQIRTTLSTLSGQRVTPSRRESIVNGGPELVLDGRVHVTVNRDGFIREGEPSWYYGWGHKRNTRTFAGVDAQGRTVLATSDGRDLDSVGLSLAETGAVAQALGLVEAMNLDGGGSTTLVVDGAVANDPSDSAGERPVGDALLVLPNR